MDDQNSLDDTLNSADAFDALLAESSRQVGPYKLLQEIGVGGMGAVWLAEQEKPVRRRVAVKLIKAGRADKQIIARFEAERQALSMMDHPNIAKVLDAGTADGGTPYFVMELVQGEPITKYCDRHKLTPHQRLQLFMPICDAIQHAHQKGIIHRDLKPSNVLVQVVDEKPVAKVIDFGLAKALQHQTKLTDKTIFTEFGQVVGTVQYMSPEQARTDAIDVDTRSDVYSLGVMLYELMAGSTPLDEETISQNAVLQLLELVREKEPPRPSQRLSSSSKKLSSISEQRKIQPTKLQQILKGDLDWIIMKSIEKDRTRRYSTPNDFADDIRRYLKGDAVEARPPTTGYRVRKFIRKNRALVGTVGLFLAVLAAGIVGTTAFALKADRARFEAEASRVDAETSAKRSSDVLNIVTDAFQSVDPSSGSNATMTAKDVLLEAQASLEQSELDDQGRISLLSKLTSCFLRLGEFDASIATAEESLRLQKTVFGDDHLDTIGAIQNLANSYDVAGRIDEAIPLYEHALKFRKIKLGADDANTLSSMVNLASSYRLAGRMDESLTLFKESVRRRQATLGNDHPSTLVALNGLAAVYQVMGRLDEATPLFEEAYRTSKRVQGEEHPKTLIFMGNVAGIYNSSGRSKEALLLKEKQLQLCHTKLGDDHPSTLHCMNDLADIYQNLGRFEEALALYQKTLQMRRIKIGSEHPYTLFTMKNMGDLLLLMNRIDEATPLFEETLKVRQAKLGEKHIDTLAAMDGLGRAFFLAGRLEEALPLKEQLLVLATSQLGSEHPATLATMVDLAYTYETADRFEKAKQLLAKRLSLQSNKEPDFVTFDARSQLGGVLLQLGEVENAERELTDGYQGMLKTAESTSPVFRDAQLKRALDRLVQLAESQDDSEAAASWQLKLDELKK